MDLPVNSPFVARFRRAVAGNWPELMAATLVCTVSELVVMTLVANGTTRVMAGEDIGRQVIMFWSMVAILAMSRYAVLKQAGLGAAKVVHEFRGTLFEKLTSCELSDLERLGRSEVQLILGRDIATLSQPSNFLFSTLTTGLNLLVVMLYLVFLNPLAGMCIALFQVALFLWFYERRKRVLQALRARARAESPLFQALNSVILGFAELRLNASRRKELVSEHMQSLSERAREGQEEVSRLQTQNFSSVDVFHYLTVGVPVFILPSLSILSGDAISQVTALVIFTVGSIPEIIINLTVLAQFDVATQRLEELERHLERTPAHDDTSSMIQLSQAKVFESLELDQLAYSYLGLRRSSTFTIGPVNLQIKRGEILFIVGGNGSGKTTLLRTLCGLYVPTSGYLRLNGVPVDRDNLDLYRSFFSAVFADFHLFDRLYGLSSVSQEQVQHWLERLMLDDKTEFRDRAFTNQSLSTGQRKRLALLAALLEDRPLMILDEVAADQDPEFRRFYYTVLLPELKSAGKTLLVVSHDDHYFYVADRLIRMDFGQMQLLQVPTSARA